MKRQLGIDIGGTFTDFVEVSEAGIRTWKRLSTPAAPQESVLAGVKSAAGHERVVHGSTIATNALLERKGPRTFLVVTGGFKDLLEIRRQTRPELYALEPRRNPHVVRRGDVIPVQERLDHEGHAVVELTEDEVARVADAAVEAGAEAVAICLLHSYVNADHEQRIAAALRERGVPTCASHEVLPEYREYERGSTTAVNAFLQQAVGEYLSGLEAELPGLRIMHSGGGLSAANEAAERPVTMILSGPAGGVLGARATAAQSGIDRVIAFDMGGTSTDVALCDGDVSLRSSTEVDGMAIQAPLVDIETVGAGGGSIARIDPGGALQVGPASAGADPGPACYGLGELPTVSDANLVLGRLWPEQALGGALLPDTGRARAAIETLGDAESMAAAIVQVANTNMARAIRRVSLERGHDPAEFTLVAFGGAGPLHACEVAADVGIGRVLIPPTPGVLSALGMLTAPEAVERSQAVLVPLDPAAADTLDATARTLEDQARAAFRAEGFVEERIAWSADMRYQGQAHELRVPLEEPAVPGAAAAFHAAHWQRYGFSAEERTVELVTLRARIEAAAPGIPIAAEQDSAFEALEGASAAGRVIHRAALADGRTVTGPCVVVQDDATTWIPDGWSGRQDAAQNLLLEPST